MNKVIYILMQENLFDVKHPSNLQFPIFFSGKGNCKTFHSFLNSTESYIRQIAWQKQIEIFGLVLPHKKPCVHLYSCK